MTTRCKIALASLLIAPLMPAACSHHEKSSASTGVKSAAYNTTCPYSGSAADASITSSHNGKTVAFCCNGCKAKFDGASTEKKMAIMAKAK